MWRKSANQEFAKAGELTHTPPSGNAVQRDVYVSGLWNILHALFL